MYGQGNVLYINSKTSTNSTTTNSNFALTYGDTVTATLVPQPDGTGALHVVVTRPLAGGGSENVFDYYDFNAVTAANMAYNATHPVYPALNIVTGAVNLGCLETATQSYTASSPTTPGAETVNGTYPTTTDWQQTNTGSTAANYYIYDDGTHLRLANKTGNTRLGDNTYATSDAIVKSGGGANLTDTISTITVTYNQGNNTQNYDRWAIGWSANANFTGAGYNGIYSPQSSSSFTNTWLANVYGQGTTLYINDYSHITATVPNYTLTYGDVISASLVPQPDGSAALHVVATRVVGGVNTEVLNYYDYMGTNAAGVSQGLAYPALEIITGAVNLSGLSAQKTPLNPSSLPVKLLSFVAVPAGKSVALNWQTATETNNSFFTVERSATGKGGWNTVTTVLSQGSNGGTYTATDTHPYDGKTFYQLKQTDADGRFTYSDVVSVDMNAAASVSVYPNPTMGDITVVVNSSGKLNIYNVAGSLVRSAEVQKGTNKISLADLNAGVYIGVLGATKIKIIKR